MICVVFYQYKKLEKVFLEAINQPPLPRQKGMFVQNTKTTASSTPATARGSDEPCRQWRCHGAKATASSGWLRDATAATTSETTTDLGRRALVGGEGYVQRPDDQKDLE